MASHADVTSIFSAELYTYNWLAYYCKNVDHAMLELVKAGMTREVLRLSWLNAENQPTHEVVVLPH